MHAVLHLRECILRYGPVHAHWTFPWERMNGCMGSIPMNRHHVEQQFMRSFVRRMVLRELPSLTGDQLSADESKLFDTMWGEVRSAARGLTAQELIDALTRLTGRGRVAGHEAVDAALVKPSKAIFDDAEYDLLQDSMHRHFISNKVTCKHNHEKSKRLRLFGDVLGSDTGRWKSSSYVLVYVDGYVRPAQCMSFVRVNVNVVFKDGDDMDCTVLLARLRFFPKAPPDEVAREHKSEAIADALENWHLNSEKWEHQVKPHAYWPVARINSRFVKAPVLAIPKSRRAREEPPPPTLFKICPLPLQLPF
jgi:hypothetical protein